MIKEFTGIIVSETTYGESSKIINVLTEEGLIGMMAKGAKKLKSKLRSGTQKFTYGKFNVYYYPERLSKLISVDVVNSLINIKSDIIKIGYLTYITELTHQVARQNSASEVYNILINTILKMEEGLDPLVLSNILEVKMLDYLGSKIELDKCVICGSSKGILTFSNKNGGFVCKNCYTNEIIYDNKVIVMMRMYYYVDIKSITSLNIKDYTKNSINNILTHYYDDYTGLYLKSKKFLQELQN